MKIDWVPVSVTLPDSDMEVIVATEGMTAAGFHDGHVWRWTCAGRIKTNVRHWAHMPEPPEELTLGTVGGGCEMKQDPTRSEIWGAPAEGGVILPEELSQQIVEPWKTIAAKLALALIGSSREFSQKALDEYQTMLNAEIFQKKEDA